MLCALFRYFGHLLKCFSISKSQDSITSFASYAISQLAPISVKGTFIVFNRWLKCNSFLSLLQCHSPVIILNYFALLVCSTQEASFSWSIYFQTWSYFSQEWTRPCLFGIFKEISSIVCAVTSIWEINIVVLNCAIDVHILPVWLGWWGLELTIVKLVNIWIGLLHFLLPPSVLWFGSDMSEVWRLR